MFYSSTYAFLALASFALLGGAASPARAADTTSATQMVRTGDLDLRTEAGAATLRHRVAVAARNVCGPSEMLGAASYNTYDHCVTDAQAAASTKADAMIASLRSTSRFALATPND